MNNIIKYELRDEEDSMELLADQMNYTVNSPFPLLKPPTHSNI